MGERRFPQIDKNNMTRRDAAPAPEGRIPRISWADLRRLMSAPRRPTLLDIRSAAEREIAHLPDDTWIPLDELGDRMGVLPRDRSIVIYCHYGESGAEAAALLRSAGWPQVAVVEGGIEEFSRWVDPTTPRYAGDPGDPLVVQQFPNGSTGCLSYLLWDRGAREAVIIDPGQDVAPYLHELRSRKLRLRSIVETHTHADHLSGHASLHLSTDATISVSRRSRAQYPHGELAEGDTLEFGGQQLTVLETPGHTMDHLCLRVRDLAFTGDTLLPGSCGRTDLGEGDPMLLWESLQQKLLTLPNETEVLPAHFGPLHGLPAPERYSSTIGFEHRTNEALLLTTTEEFVDYMTHGWPPRPARFDEIVRSNLST